MTSAETQFEPAWFEGEGLGDLQVVVVVRGEVVAMQQQSERAVYIDYAARFPDNYRLAHTDGAANDDLRRIQEARAAALRDRILGGVATIRPVDAQDTIAITGWLAFVRFTIFAWLDDPAIDRDTLRDLCARTLWGALALPVVDTASPPTATS